MESTHQPTFAPLPGAQSASDGSSRTESEPIRTVARRTASPRFHRSASVALRGPLWLFFMKYREGMKRAGRRGGMRVRLS